MAEFEINAALVRAWQGAGLPYPTAYEGKAFTPEQGKPWAALYLLPAGTAPAGIGIQAPLEHVGILQVDLNQPLDAGAPVMLKDADAVSLRFTPGASFEFGGTKVNIERCTRSSIRRSEGWLTLSLSIRYRSWQHRVTP
ncbi:phage tail terminator-like protein [Xylophilus sp.]|uniref:phage tail terminator-like protein n=1 Tax=Xylophilus sp. TaxID=2653893 RepID=UPI0013B87601|nr:phage tail terminator-like protein [Xylophilus sp.]KAF1045607.1 MAG: hypothetical protein GAK38_02899 [Xylophilus sp.]